MFPFILDNEFRYVHREKLPNFLLLMKTSRNLVLKTFHTVNRLRKSKVLHIQSFDSIKATANDYAQRIKCVIYLLELFLTLGSSALTEN